MRKYNARVIDAIMFGRLWVRANASPSVSVSVSVCVCACVCLCVSLCLCVCVSMDVVFIFVSARLCLCGCLLQVLGDPAAREAYNQHLRDRERYVCTTEMYTFIHPFSQSSF